MPSSHRGRVSDTPIEPTLVQMLVREVLERAGLDPELIDLASIADHFALDEFGYLHYQLQLEAIVEK